MGSINQAPTSPPPQSSPLKGEEIYRVNLPLERE